MNIDYKTIKHYLKNVYFINGTAYAGKSTMVAMLAKKHHMIHCGENYHLSFVHEMITPEQYPNMSYFQTMKSWQEFINRTPEEYANWIEGTTRELIEFEIMELVSLSRNQKVIVDTNIPVDVLKKIADDHQVAIMLYPQSMSVDRFFDREDPDKQFLLSKIDEAEDPVKTMSNFRACIAKVNSQENYDTFAQSGFFTIVRENELEDTKEQTLRLLEEHFKLI